MAVRLSRLPSELTDRFGAVETASPDPGRKNAAVAAVLRPPPGPVPTAAADAGDGPPDPPIRDCDLLVIRRAESRRDPWSGQMALPGGRLDESDAGLAAAAAREAREETGIDLVAGGTLLGRIETMRPQGIRVPAITIWPFVFRVGRGAAARVASHEVASVHWVPVEALLDPANRGSHAWRYGGVVREFPCIRIDGRVIWGLTYRVLMQLLQMA